MIKSLLSFFIIIFLHNSLLSQNVDTNQLLLKLKTSKDTVRVNILNQLSKIYSTYELNKAEDYALSALEIAQDLGYHHGLFYCYLNLANISRIRGDLKKDSAYLQKSIDLSSKNGYKDLLGEAHDGLFSHAFHRGNYNSAERHLNTAMEIAVELNHPGLLAQSYSNTGILYGIRGNHTKAVAYFMKSMEKFRSLGDSLNVGTELGHIGYTFTLAGSYDQALKYLNQAYEIHKALNDKYKTGWVLANIGVTYNHLNKDSTAMRYYKESLKVARQLKDYRLILTNLDNIGGWYSLHKDYDKANEYLSKAYTLSSEIGQNSRTVYLSGNLAENYLYSGDLDKAREFGETQLKLANEQKIIYEQKTAYYTLSQIYAGQNNFSGAHQALLGYIRVNDSIFNQEKSRQIESLRAEYEADKREQAILALKKDKEAAEYRKNLYALLAGLMLIMGCLIYYTQRLKAKKNRELLEKGQEVEKMQSRFFTNITHEIRTPLTLILAPLAVLADRINDPGLNQQILIMKKNGRRMLTLINQLLDISRLESGNLKLKVARGNIISIVRGVTMSFQSWAESKHIELRVKSEAEMLMLYFDQDKIEKVLSNLLSNAFKFTPEGGDIQVEARSIVYNNIEYLQVAVKDTGKGIPKDKVSRIFDRFYQADDSLTRGYEGSGIGLALVKEFIELHHGSISAVSKDGKGTEMIVLLPLGKKHFIADGLTVEEEMDENGSVAPKDVFSGINETHDDKAKKAGDPKKSVVLLIEDHKDVRGYVKEILKGGYTVLEANDGKAGVAEAFKYIPDLILSDVMMPNMDGHQVCSCLKADEKTSHIPIILLTAKASMENKIEGLHTQADDYLTKPFVPGELLARIQNLIESRKKLRERFQRNVSLKPAEIAKNAVDVEFLERLMEIFEKNTDNELFSVETLGNMMNMSRSQLHRKLSALTGHGPNQLIRSFRLNRAHDLLKLQAATTSEIAYAVGFSSPSYFTKCFREQFGYTPTEVQVTPTNSQSR